VRACVRAHTAVNSPPLSTVPWYICVHARVHAALAALFPRFWLPLFLAALRGCTEHHPNALRRRQRYTSTHASTHTHTHTHTPLWTRHWPSRARGSRKTRGGFAAAPSLQIPRRSLGSGTAACLPRAHLPRPAAPALPVDVPLGARAPPQRDVRWGVYGTAPRAHRAPPCSWRPLSRSRDSRRRRCATGTRPNPESTRCSWGTDGCRAARRPPRTVPASLRASRRATRRQTTRRERAGRSADRRGRQPPPRSAAASRGRRGGALH